MLFVNKVFGSSGKEDPKKEVYAIITLEDIIERLINKQIGDEDDNLSDEEDKDLEKQEDLKKGLSAEAIKQREEKLEAKKAERKAAKNNVIQLFKNNKASEAMQDSERAAVVAYLHEYVDQFKILKLEQVQRLVDNASVTSRQENDIKSIVSKSKKGEM
jgi:hypothetical protein